MPSMLLFIDFQGTMTTELYCSVDSKTDIVPGWILKVVRM